MVVLVGEGGGGEEGREVAAAAAAAGTVLLHQHVYLLSIKIMPEGGFLLNIL